MRLKLLFEDIEYRDALIETLSKSEKNIYIELIESITQDSFTYGTILLTDRSEEFLCSLIDLNFASRVVLFTNCSSDSIYSNSNESNGFNRIFKYQNANRILSEIAELNFRINGSAGSQLITTNKYIVCGDSTEQCSIFSNILARDIRFHHGGTIMVLSLTFINSHPISDEIDCSSFARMMYLRKIGRDILQEAYTYTDSYGVSYLRLPLGNNPLAYMDFESMLELSSYLCDGKIDTLIIDIGSELSPRNQKLFKIADDVLIINHGGRSTDWKSFSIFNDKAINSRTRSFNGIDVELSLDDFIREKYGVLIEDENQESDSKTIRKRNRQARNRN